MKLCAGTAVSPVLDWLLLGNRWDAVDLGKLRALGVKSIVNVTRAVPNAFPDEMRCGDSHKRTHARAYTHTHIGHTQTTYTQGT